MQRAQSTFIPLILFASTWLYIGFMYTLQLSARISADFQTIWLFIFGVIFCFFVGAFMGSVIGTSNRTKAIQLDYRKTDRLAHQMTLAITAFALLEVAVERFIPLFTMLQGIQISHFEFGLSTIHGMVIAGFLGVGLYYMDRALEDNGTSRKLFLLLASLPVLYSILFVSRKMFVVCFLQYVAIYLVRSGIRLRTVFIGILGMIFFVYLFGFFGEVRGRSAVLDVYGGLSPVFDFPGSTGFKWIYMYSVTPIDNLIHTISSYSPEFNLFPSNTLGGLIPSALSQMISGSSGLSRFAEAAEARYWLQSNVFNVSTAFNPAYLDWGIFGIVSYCFVVGFVVTKFSMNMVTSVDRALMSVFTIGGLLTVFTNNFGNLNFTGQFIFLFILLKFGQTYSRKVSARSIRKVSVSEQVR